ncbi:MAG: resolvase [Flavisolibacter sp.]|jgi:hypothetical protein|nr:resolvase [Flavisolibacter sp.]
MPVYINSFIKLAEFISVLKKESTVFFFPGYCFFRFSVSSLSLALIQAMAKAKKSSTSNSGDLLTATASLNTSTSPQKAPRLGFVDLGTESRRVENKTYPIVSANSVALEKLPVSREVFLKVNEVQSANLHGYKMTVENESISLKRFIRCEKCGGHLAGYLAHKNQKFYYKCRTKGRGVNKRANDLHPQFTTLLDDYTHSCDGRAATLN